MASPENLRAALVAAASMYPEGYGTLKQLTTITATQHVQMVFDRAEEMAEWLEAKEDGQNPTASEIIKAVAKAKQPPAEYSMFRDKAQAEDYIAWAERHKLADNQANQARYLDTLPER